MATLVKDKPTVAEPAPAKAPEKVNVEVLEKKAPEARHALARPRLGPFELMRRMLEGDFFDLPRMPWRDEEIFAPDFNMKETKEAFIVKGDVPGIEAKDLDVSLTRDRLSIKGRREEEKKEEGEAYYTFERSFGSFSRTFTLPEGIDADKISADLKDGVLTIVVPRLAEAKVETKQVEVKPAEPKA